MQKIFIISFSPLHRDPRVRRQVNSLKARYKITCAGYTDINDPKVTFWPVVLSSRSKVQKLKSAILFLTRQYKKYYWQRREVIGLYNVWKKNKCKKFDLVIANDIESVIVAREIAGESPLFVDAHEYSPRESNEFIWRLLRAPFIDWECRNYLKKAELLSTVNNSLSQEYEREYGKESIIIFSAPIHRKLKQKLHFAGNIRLVHHGGAARERGLEEIINLLDYLSDEYTLDFYLVSISRQSKLYIQELIDLSKKHGDRVTFREAVPTDELPEVLNEYDIGIALIQPKNFNYAHCLPNKFFEFVQARLVVASGPTPDMKALIEKYDLGVVSENFSAESLAREIASLSIDDINKIKNSVHLNAKALSFQESGELLVKSVEDLIKKHG